MTQQETPRVEGLRIWVPPDSFEQDYNVVSFEKAMADFQALNILRKLGDEAIYCSGDNRVVYHTVDSLNVQHRLSKLQQEPSPISSGLQPDQIVDSSVMGEEACARELHLGLGRTSLCLAVNAEQRDDFVAAADDLKNVFLMLGQPIHSIDELMHTTVRREDLIYMFVQAARKHKTLSRKDATELADALDHGILPIPQGRNQKIFETWGQARGKSFIERVGFIQKKHTHSPQDGNLKKDKSTLAKQPHFTHYEEPVAEVKKTEKRTKAEVFIFRLFRDRRHIPYSQKLAHVHDTFLGEDPKPIDIRNDTKMELSRLGVEAYLETVKIREDDAAGQILSYLSKRRGNYKSPLLPIIVAGNFLTAKVNTSGGSNGTPGELPGLSTRGIPLGFRAIRYTLEKNSPAGKDSDTKRLGDLVEAYLQAAFATSDEQSYEIPEAPEDFMSTQDFGLAHGVGKKTLEAILPNYGIDANTYRFGQWMRRGLSPDDQTVLESNLDELRIEPAPKGYRSISGFSHVSGVAKPEVDKLIEDHGIETGTHRFRSKVGKSLNPDAQRRLSKLLGKEIRIIE